MKIYSKRRFWVKILQFAILLYCIVGIVLYWVQDRVLFRGDTLSKDHKWRIDAPFKEMNIPVNATDTINLIDFIADSSVPKKGIVVYLHGNRGNIERYDQFAKIFTDNGYEVLMPDYPGFGKSVGELNEENLENLGLTVQQLAASKFEADSIIIYGKSLGTGIASFVAANSKNKTLILETPYSSIPSLYQNRLIVFPGSRMANYQLNTMKNLQDVDEKVIVFHGTADDVIPYENAEEIKPFLKSGDEFHTIQGANHRNIYRKNLYQKVMKDLLQ